MLEATTRIIDGYTVRIVPLLGTHAVRLFAKVRKVLVPALIMTISSTKGMLSTRKDGEKFKTSDFLGADIDFTKISDAIAGISEHMTPDEELTFFKEALATTFINEKCVADEAQFNDVFQGNVLLLYKILWATLEVNFGDFLSAVGIGGMSQSAAAIPTQK